MPIQASTISRNSRPASSEASFDHDHPEDTPASVLASRAYHHGRHLVESLEQLELHAYLEERPCYLAYRAYRASVHVQPVLQHLANRGLDLGQGAHLTQTAQSLRA